MKKCRQISYSLSLYLLGQHKRVGMRAYATGVNTLNNMMVKAKELEDNFKIKEAAKTYEKIIYEIDPTYEPAYGKLMNIWLTYSSAYGLKKDKVDKYLKQHQTYILKAKDYTHSMPKNHQ